MANQTIETPLGPVVIHARNGKITAIDFGEGPADLPDEITGEAARQIEEYFAGQRLEFDLPLELTGTPYQQRVWKEIDAIPYGGKASYGDIARKLDSGPRPVGNACGRNPIPVVVPCHRVVGGSGKLGGYSGLIGLRGKQWLLDHETRHLVRYADTAHTPGPIHMIATQQQRKEMP